MAADMPVAETVTPRGCALPELDAVLGEVEFKISESREGISPEADETLSAARHAVWEAMQELQLTQKIETALRSRDALERDAAIREIAAMGDLKSLPALIKIAKDEEVPQATRSIAWKAVQTIPAQAEAGYVSRARDTFRNVFKQMQEVVVAKVDDYLQSSARLDNFRGCLCSEVIIGSVQQRKAEIYRAKPGEACAINVWLQPNANPSVHSQPVVIKNGRDAVETSFEISADGDAVLVAPCRTDIRTRQNTLSESRRFSFRAPSGGGVNVWIQLFQKNRLIQSDAIRFAVDS